jgi:peptidoglycan L-alanyl-D-glutamate endopeptidase CwlK
MNDSSKAKLAQVHPVLADRVYQLEALLTFPVIITQGLRTWPQQSTLWQQGRNPDGSYIDPIHKTGVVTDAKAGQSMHNYGLAIDIAPMGPDGKVDWDGKDDRWGEILSKAPLCKLSEGAKWRTFPDEPHLYPVECPADPDDDIVDLMTNQGIQAVWDSFKLII